MTADEKRSRMNELRPLIAELRVQREEAEVLFKSLNDKWMKAEREYKYLDYQLALQDERYVKVKKEKKTEDKLNLAQILMIAEKLGVEIDIHDENDD
jgi:hypothetical protein